MVQYKDDLLVSCLVFVLALPPEIVVSELFHISPAIQMALKMGLSYLSLARTTIDALELWSKTLPPDIIKPLYKNILPYLDAYLTSESDSGESYDKCLS